MTSKFLEGLMSPDRRTFLQVAGATVASLNTAACIRKPRERILPFAKRPEDLVPGEPKYYASAFSVGGSVLGILAKSTDGRPTKIEGNPEHASSRGSTNTWAQASVLTLYAPERSRFPHQGGSSVEPDALNGFLKTMAGKLAESDGAGLAVLLDETPSPTLGRLLTELKDALPQAKLYTHDGAGEANARAGASMLGAENITWTISGQPRVIATFDADPMATEGDVVSFTRMFAEGREPHLGDAANRLYALEPQLSLTGANADHRLAVKGAQVGDHLAALASQLRAGGLDVPDMGAPAEVKNSAFVKALAKDLLSRPRGSTLVIVGERQPPHVHALGMLVNAALGNIGRTVTVTPRALPASGSIEELAAAIRAKKVDQLVVLGGNPVYDAPGDLEFAKLFASVSTTVHLGLHRDETGTVATWHIPKSHYLEAWNDLQSREGTVAIQQPLIAPLYDSMSEIELVGRLLGQTETGYELVRATHQSAVAEGFDKAWQTWLHDGVAPQVAVAAVTPELDASGLEGAWSKGADDSGLELAFVRDATVLDGRFAGSPWLQELPDPITKLVWDNAALLSPATADKLGVENGDLIDVTHHAQTVRIAVWVQPGTADDVVVLPIGYGLTSSGEFAKSGFSVAPLRTAESPWTLTGASAKKAGAKYELACVQVETDIHDRPLIRSASRKDFSEAPNFVDKFDTMDESHIETLLWEEPNPTDGHQWAMTIDLNSCTGCGACTVACQAENNIPWVGKEDCLNGREMHWIRVDRYFDQQDRNVQVKIQPLTCAHCETAPCENVCPVGATVHSPEGMNDMAYNRCIGTRYCANNCPYKVRRFNFFHYTHRNDEDYGMGIAMQRNPDVTVRYRGVMEKCTYCVQRVNRARIDAKVNRDGVIRDGEVTTACAQACPAEAITFGDMNDPNSRVAKKRADSRNYAVLSELNLEPRTTYLGKLYHPNPELEEA